MIMDGELDHIPEAAFNLKGSIEEAIEGWRKNVIGRVSHVFGNCSPEATLFSGEIEALSLPGTNGSFQLLENHAPIVATLHWNRKNQRNIHPKRKHQRPI